MFCFLCWWVGSGRNNGLRRYGQELTKYIFALCLDLTNIEHSTVCFDCQQVRYYISVQIVPRLSFIYTILCRSRNLSTPTISSLITSHVQVCISNSIIPKQ